MIRLAHRLILAALLSSFIFSCEDDHGSFTKCVRVKLVKQMCGQAVLEILDPLHHNMGQSWVDHAGKQYENVFSTILPCSLQVGSADEFMIEFTNELTDQGCNRCMALLEGPKKFAYIKSCMPICGPSIEEGHP